MKHPQFARMMAAQLSDGALSSQDRERLERHLAVCDHCFATWEQLQNVDRHVRTGIGLTPSSAFVRKLENSIASLPPRRARGPGGKRLGLMTAPFLILCATFLMTVHALWQQPALWIRFFLVHLPRIIAESDRVIQSDPIQRGSLALQSLQDQLQSQLLALTQMSALTSVLVGYLVITGLLGLVGWCLLHRMNLQTPVLAGRSS